MTATSRRRAALAATLSSCLLAPLVPLVAPSSAHAQAASAAEVEALRRSVEALVKENAELRTTVERLDGRVTEASDRARAAEESAETARTPALSAAPLGAAPLAGQQAGTTLGRGRLQLLDLSLDVLSAGGFSSAEDDELELLQGGGHDPRRRGFNLPNVELSFQGAIDPFLTGEAHLIYFLDPEGESRFEMEEAFATTRMLPFALEEAGLQLEVGHFFTEFGRINPQHPHAWHWQDQPVVNTRFFGEDGMRNPGVRLGWLTPLPWFSELHLGAQNAQGETMVSFLANDEVFEERAIGGRPFADPGVHSVADLVKLVRWVNSVDLSDTTSAQLGLSGLHGPNGTGSSADTTILGTDLVVKWRGLPGDRGWPFLFLETEWMWRRYEADAFSGCLDPDACQVPLELGDDVLRDWGGYAQLLWGFRRGWAAGLRYEIASGAGSDFDVETASFVSREGDSYRDDRTRISPLLTYYPSEFSRIRLQYNYDRAEFLDDADHEHTLWMGIEFFFGSHPAHAF